MSRVLLVNGSPNNNGNTASALSIIKSVLNQKGMITRRFELGNKPVRGCINCQRCATNHRCVGIYAVLVNTITVAPNLHSALWGVAGYTVLLCFMLFKTGSIAQSIFNSH